jgi:hypothetical protein
MANLNPLQLMAMLRGGNPQQIAQQIIQQNYPNNPMMQQLLNLGQQGDVQSLQKIAQQICAQQGCNFETEMSNLMSMLGQR